MLTTRGGLWLWRTDSSGIARAPGRHSTQPLLLRPTYSATESLGPHPKLTVDNDQGSIKKYGIV